MYSCVILFQNDPQRSTSFVKHGGGSVMIVMIGLYGSQRTWFPYL